MQRWTVPRLWKGRTVAVLASGPSMSLAVAEEVRAAGLPTIVTNLTHRIAPWADMLYGADVDWWSHDTNRDAHQFKGLKVSCSEIGGSVLCLASSGEFGFDPNPATVRTGSNSAYQATHIAIHGGAAKVLLFGCDMTDRKGKHWHKDHPRPLRETGPNTFKKWIKAFKTLKDDLEAKGVDTEIVNCTPDSAIPWFRFSTLKDEVCPAPTT